MLGFLDYCRYDSPELSRHFIERARQPRQLLRHVGELHGSEIAGAEPVCRGDEAVELVVDLTHCPGRGTGSDHHRQDTEQNDEGLVPAGFAAEGQRPVERLLGLGIAEPVHVGHQAVRGAARPGGNGSRFVRLSDVRQCVGGGVRHLQGRLIVGDFVHNPPVGVGERSQVAIAGLIGVGRIAAGHELFLDRGARIQEVVLGGPNLAENRSHERVGDACSGLHCLQVFLDRAADGADGPCTQHGHGKDEHHQRGHHHADEPSETVRQFHWPPAG